VIIDDDLADAVPNLSLLTHMPSSPPFADVVLLCSPQNSPPQTRQKRSIYEELSDNKSVSTSTEGESDGTSTNDKNIDKDDHPTNFVNDATTRKRFGFTAYKINKQIKSKNLLRDYYKCNQAGCAAKYYVDKSPTGNTESKYNGENHNHPPPKKLRLLPEIKRNLKERMKVV
jgi:hypothetical protein